MNRTGKVKAHDNSEQINCLNNRPPAALQLELILCQGYLPAYDVYSVSLVSHFFRKLFFSYTLKSDHIKNLPRKKGDWEDIASNFVSVTLARQVSQFLNKPDGIWTPQEKFEQFPSECLKDEFLPFNSIFLRSRGLDRILIKNALAIKKCTLSYLLVNAPIITKQLTHPNVLTNVDYVLVGLLDVKELNSLTYAAKTCLALECIQQRMLDGTITVEAVKKYDQLTAIALKVWNSYSFCREFRKQLTFEQVIYDPKQARAFMDSKYIREIIFKERQENFKKRVKIENDFR
jgi:hypothetical protein